MSWPDMNRKTEPRTRLRAAALIAAALAAAPAWSQIDERRPSGPVTVRADRAEWRNEGLMVYTGNVSLSTDGVTLHGDRLALRQIRAGRYQATVTGNPARLEHGPQAADQPPISADSRTILYDSGTGELELNGQVVLRRGKDRLVGERIIYNLRDRRIQADGGSGGQQVQITIEPPASEPEPQP